MAEVKTRNDSLMIPPPLREEEEGLIFPIFDFPLFIYLFFSLENMRIVTKKNS